MRKLFPWLIALAMLLVVFGTIYTVVQQSQRSDANYPQIQLAEDTSSGIKQGDLPATLVGQEVNMAKSLAPFTNVYNEKGGVILGSGNLDGKVPKPPLGMLQAAKGKEYHAVT